MSNVKLFLIDPKISPKIIYTFYKHDLNIDKLHRDIFHDIIEGQVLIVSSFTDMLNVFKNKPQLILTVCTHSMHH